MDSEDKAVVWIFAIVFGTLAIVLIADAVVSALGGG